MPTRARAWHPYIWPGSRRTVWLGASEASTAVCLEIQSLGAMPSLAWACLMVKNSRMAKTFRKTRKVFDNGDAHFLTFSCFKRMPLLSKDRSRQWLVDGINLSRERNPFDLWAWVIMPEHVHLVLLPHSGVKISSILTTMKQSVSRRAMIWLKENSPDFLERLLDRQPSGKSSHRFWQRGGGYDRNLRSSRDVHEKIAYCHENPVKRGWVASPKDWKWSSANGWQSRKVDLLSLDRDSVPTLNSTEDSLGSKLLR